MKTQRFAHEAIVLLLLVVAIGAIALQSNFNFTGYSVLGEYSTQESCETAGYIWEDFTTENCTEIGDCAVCEEGCVESYTETLCVEGCQSDCTNITDCAVCEEGCVESYTETLCVEGCQTSCEECEDVVTGGQCTGDICDAEHLSLCLDETTCTTANGYWYNSICNSEEECVPETCDSLNYGCGSVSDGCGSSLSCGSCNSGYSCSSGQCEEDEEESTTQVPITALTTSESTSSSSDEITTCIPNWECGDWQTCIGGIQDRVCTDANNCGSQEGFPESSQSCVEEVLETCSDQIKNQDETGIDCGGVCKKCSFFTIVGSVVSGPIDAGKNFVLKGMFGSTLKTIISLGSIVLIIGGIVCFNLLKRRKLDVATPSYTPVVEEDHEENQD